MAILHAHASVPPSQHDSDHLPTAFDAFHPPSYFVKFLFQHCGEIRYIVFVSNEESSVDNQVLRSDTHMQRAFEQPEPQRSRAKHAKRLSGGGGFGRAMLVFSRWSS